MKVPRDGKTGQSDTSVSARKLVHLTEDQGDLKLPSKSMILVLVQVTTLMGVLIDTQSLMEVQWKCKGAKKHTKPP
jgi:hypothetical protein